MENLVTIIHVLAAAGVIGLVLLQHGKGADMGAAFGSGASGSLFGVSGSTNFLSKATAACVTVFFITSLALAYLASHRAGSGSVIKAATQSSEVKTTAKPIEIAPIETKTDGAKSEVQIPSTGSAAKDVPN